MRLGLCRSGGWLFAWLTTAIFNGTRRAYVFERVSVVFVAVVVGRVYLFICVYSVHMRWRSAALVHTHIHTIARTHTRHVDTTRCTTVQIENLVMNSALIVASVALYEHGRYAAMYGGRSAGVSRCLSVQGRWLCENEMDAIRTCKRETHPLHISIAITTTPNTRQ